MLNLLRQEGFKMVKGNAFRGWTIVLVLWQILAALAAKRGIIDPSSYVSSLGSFSTFGSIIMVVLASTIITNEFAQGTIKNLLDRQYSRLQVFISKMLTLVWLYVFFLVIAVILTFAMKLILFNDLQFASGFTKNFGIFIAGDILNKFLLLGTVLLISSIAKKSSGVAIGIGVVFIFASQLIATISVILIQAHEWIKWNPFTFFFTSGQLQSSQVNSITHLNNPQMIIGTIIYGLIFYAIAEYIFEKRNV